MLVDNFFIFFILNDHERSPKIYEGKRRFTKVLRTFFFGERSETFGNVENSGVIKERYCSYDDEPYFINVKLDGWYADSWEWF